MGYKKLKDKGAFVEALSQSELSPPEKFTADYYILAVPV
jgi:hypothetical protein